MKVAVLGEDGALARATREELARRGHAVAADARECVIYLPGRGNSLDGLRKLSGIGRIVVRSHAAAYGAVAKNPGELSEDRAPLLADDAPEQRWLLAERLAAEGVVEGNWAAVRLPTLLDVADPHPMDRIVRGLASRRVLVVPGRDPNIQFISLADAARALVAAAESSASGIFNAAGDGSLPLKQACRAAGAMRLPMPKWAHRLMDSSEGPERLEYNWTVSGARAAGGLNFRASQSSREVLESFIQARGGGRPEILKNEFDPWGLDLDYIAAWEPWFRFLKRVYWRIDFEGMENIPAAGRTVFVSNHRGFMPLDAVMHLSMVLAERRRVIRFLIIPCLLYFPFLADFLTKLGGVIASQENAAKLMAGENLVGIFPEGIRGTFLPYRETYKLRDFARSAVAAVAVEHQAPIIPAAVVGHSEIFPIIGRFDWAWAKKLTGWPYFPIAPPFPFLPVMPFPSKWHVRILPPVAVNHFRPEDARNERLMAELARYVQNIVQTNIDQMRARRKHILWGRVLDGTAPGREEFRPRAQSMPQTAKA